jgi:hypothetical protein
MPASQPTSAPSDGQPVKKDWVSVIGELGPVILGLGALAVAGWTTWLAHKERTAPYKQALYTKRVEVYAEIMNAIADLVAAMRDRTLTGTNSKVWVDFVFEATRWYVFLPRRTTEKVADFYSAVENILKLADSGKGLDPEGLEKHSKQVREAVIKLVIEARTDLGIDPLGQEMFDLFGMLPERQY